MTRRPRWDTAALTDPAAQGVHAALIAFNASVMALSALDPITTELVRLRCARSHDCRLCQATRSVASVEAGMDDALADRIDRYETSDLAERHKVALRLTDALITSPRDLDAALVAQAHEHFTTEELAELCLYVVKFSTQKIGVALGTDGTDAVPLNDDGVTFVAYADDGTLAGFSASPQNR